VQAVVLGELAKHSVSEMRKYAPKKRKGGEERNLQFRPEDIRAQTEGPAFNVPSNALGDDALRVLAALLEYLTAEMLELGGNGARNEASENGIFPENGTYPTSLRVSCAHVRTAIEEDSELDALFPAVWIDFAPAHISSEDEPSVPEPGIVSISINRADAARVYFKIKLISPFKRLMDVYGKREGHRVDTLQFSFQGKCFDATATAAELGLVDDDIIDVSVLELRGLGCIPKGLRDELSALVQSSTAVFPDLVGMGAFEKAKALLQEGDRDSKSPDTVHKAAKHYNCAIVLYARACEELSSNYRGVTFNQIGILYSRTRQRDKAVQLYGAAIEEYGDKSKDAYRWHNNLRASLTHLGRTAEAMTACQHVLERCPANEHGREMRKENEKALAALGKKADAESKGTAAVHNMVNFLKSDLENFDSLIDSGEESKIKTVWARPGRLSTLSVSHSKSFFVRRFCMGTQGA
jgi:tetratricopeptide (TPR) repeat protein